MVSLVVELVVELLAVLLSVELLAVLLPVELLLVVLLSVELLSVELTVPLSITGTGNRDAITPLMSSGIECLISIVAPYVFDADNSKKLTS